MKNFCFLLAAVLFAQMSIAQIQLEHTYLDGPIKRIVLDVSGETYLQLTNYACHLAIFDSIHQKKQTLDLGSVSSCNPYSVTEQIIDGDLGVEVLYSWLDAGPGIANGYTFRDDDGTFLELGNGAVLSAPPGKAPKILTGGRRVLSLPSFLPEHTYTNDYNTHYVLNRQVFPVDDERYIFYNTEAFDGFSFFDAGHHLVETFNPPYPGFVYLNNITQQYFNQDTMFEFWGIRKADKPDTNGNEYFFEVVQEDGHVLFSLPAKGGALHKTANYPDVLSIKNFKSPDTKQTVVVDVQTLQPVHTFDGFVNRHESPNGSIYYLEEWEYKPAILRAYDESFNQIASFDISHHIWAAGSTKGMFSTGNLIELHYTTYNTDGKTQVECIDQNGNLLYSFPGASESILDWSPGLSPKFLVRYQSDSTQVYRFDKSSLVENPGQELDATIWPNPFTALIHVQLQKTMDADIQLLNANGKCIGSYHFSDMKQISIPAESLDSGVYYLHLKTDRKHNIVKLVKAE